MSVKLGTVCIILGLAISEAIIRNYGYDAKLDVPSHWTHLEDTGCLHNLELDDNVTDESLSPEDERRFLLELFDKTNGHGWREKTKWAENNTDHCQWAGIHCYPNTSYVKWIDLTNNDLSGTPPNFWKLRNLQGICMSRNPQMMGMLSEIISPNMTRLRRLCLSFADIRGIIPWDIILRLDNLEKLQICCMVGGRHGLSGTLPANIGTLYKLQVLSLGENNIVSDFPHSIGNLTRLWFLDLEYIKLKSGNLSYLDSLRDLQSLHMINCHIGGGFPSNFGKMHPNIRDISLLDNELEGELTDESLLGLNKLERLTLSGNNFHGLLPQSFTTLSSLKVLDLSHNKFSGFQKNMTFNANLEILYLNDNKYMDNLTILVDALQPCNKNFPILVASSCSFKGELPSAVWNFALLTFLDLSNNKLSGKMTVSHNNMVYLFHLSLSSNNFSGQVPTTAFFAALKALTYFNISDNPLLRMPLCTYLKARYEFVHHYQNYSCPSIEITSTRGIVDMDPVTYQYSLCFCNYEFYGYSNHCLPCKDGGICQKEATSLIVSGSPPKEKHTDEVRMTIKKGYWPSGNSFVNIKRLVKCSEKVTFGEEVCSPSGKCKCWVILTDNGQLTTSCNQSCICSYGNTGRFCSKCISGYYKKGDVCVRCERFSHNFPVVMTVCFVVSLVASVFMLACFQAHRRMSLIMISIFVVALIILFEFSIIPGWFFIIMFAVWILGLSTESDRTQSFICIAVFYFQSLDAMLSETNIWPDSILLFKYKLTNVFNFELAQLTCSFHSVSRPEVSFATILLLPVAGLILLWLVHLLSKACGNCIPSSICKRLTIQLLLLVYFPITAHTLAALSPCAHHDGLSFIRDTPWLDCHGTSHNWLTTLAYISLSTYVIAIPLVVFLPLLHRHVNLDGTVSPETETWLKPMYEEFKQEYHRWYPLIFLARRLFLAMMLSLLPSTSCYQILGITLLLLVFIVIILIKKPYVEYSQLFAFENAADIAISIVLLLSFVGFAVMQNSSHIDNTLITLVVIVNMVVVIFCVVGLLLLFAINLLKPNRQDYEQIPNNREVNP